MVTWGHFYKKFLVQVFLDTKSHTDYGGIKIFVQNGPKLVAGVPRKMLIRPQNDK